jgi:flagellar hook-basal body complex protein FliE
MVKMATPVDAARAYAALARVSDPLGGSRLAGNEQADPTFGAVLKDALATAVAAGRKADSQAQAVAAGKANVVDVVTAVAETEVAIETLVSVRDRVISAYEEIMKMPI